MRFHWADYVVFSLTVAGSTTIGLYHGFTRRKNPGIDVYLMAERRMPVLPVSVSLYVSWLSAISFLSDPVLPWRYLLGDWRRLRAGNARHWRSLRAEVSPHEAHQRLQGNVRVSKPTEV